MRVILSPAKKMDFSGISQNIPHTLPQFNNDINMLVRRVRLLSTTDIREVMRLSDHLADLTYARFQNLGTPIRGETAEPAALAFAGDTYVGLQARSLSLDDLQWAQRHIRILSGLYGMLRPLDLIEPYRLEMGTKLDTVRGKDLYAFWRERLSAALNDEQRENKKSVIINLASAEYFKALQSRNLTGHIVTPVFLEEKDGRARSIGLMAKRARGMMARYIIENRLHAPDALQSFNSEGYRFSSERSDAKTLVFARIQPEALRKKPHNPRSLSKNTSHIHQEVETL